MVLMTEATTSSAVTVLPLWNVAPFLSLNTHFLAPSEGSKLSARSGTTLPLASISVRLFDKVPRDAGERVEVDTRVQCWWRRHRDADL